MDKSTTNQRQVRFDCSGVGSYQNEVRGGGKIVPWTTSSYILSGFEVAFLPIHIKVIGMIMRVVG